VDHLAETKSFFAEVDMTAHVITINKNLKKKNSVLLLPQLMFLKKSQSMAGILRRRHSGRPAAGQPQILAGILRCRPDPEIDATAAALLAADSLFRRCGQRLATPPRSTRCSLATSCGPQATTCAPRILNPYTRTRPR
jgi:hypothetical protein